MLKMHVLQSHKCKKTAIIEETTKVLVKKSTYVDAVHLRQRPTTLLKICNRGNNERITAEKQLK